MLNIKSIILNTVFVLIFIPAWLYIYTFLHEIGHAMVITYYGGTIVSFELGFNARVISYGANFTTFGAALNNAAGLLFPMIVGFLFILLYSPKVKEVCYHICYLVMILSLICFASIWVLVPVLSLYIEMPHDDTMKFLETTGFDPLLVASGGLLLIIMIMLLASSKGFFKTVGRGLDYLKTDKRISHIYWFLVVLVILIIVISAFLLVYSLMTSTLLFYI